MESHHKKHIVTHIGFQGCGHTIWWLFQLGSFLIPNNEEYGHVGLFVGLVVAVLSIAKQNDWLKF